MSDLELDAADVIVTAKGFSHATLGVLREQIPPRQRHGVFLSSVTRMDHELPVQPGTDIHHGDTLKFTGTEADPGVFLPKVGFRIDPASPHPSPSARSAVNGSSPGITAVQQ